MAVFDNSIFAEYCGFPSAVFNCHSYFRNTIFEIGAAFWDVNFKYDVTFNSACFGGEASFADALFLDDVDMNINALEFLDLSGSTIENHFNMDEINPCYFGALEIKGIKNRGKLFIPKKLITGIEKPLTTLLNEVEKEYEIAQEEYGLLYDNYKRIPHYIKEIDHAYYKFREMGRKALCEKWKKNRSFSGFLKWVWDKVALSLCFGYGVRTWRIIATSILSIVVFGLVYSGFTSFITVRGVKTLSEAVGGNWWQGLKQSMYFSMVTFATLGYGDLSPAEGWMQYVCGFEGLWGLFLMALFVVAFGRKLLR